MSTKAKAAPVIEFRFVRVNPFIEAGNGEAYWFEHDGTTYCYEEYSTEDHSGSAWYDATGMNPIPCPFDEDQLERLDVELQAFKDDWWTLWRRYVEPAIGRAQREAIKRQEKRHAVDP